MYYTVGDGQDLSAPTCPERALLLPPSLRDWLPEDHLAYFVSDLIDQLDLSAITTVYEDEDRGLVTTEMTMELICETCYVYTRGSHSLAGPLNAGLIPASSP
jgi:hypothetical protein